jgi:hypothetical protein
LVAAAQALEKGLVELLETVLVEALETRPLHHHTKRRRHPHMLLGQQHPAREEHDERRILPRRSIGRNPWGM